jgi:hypothetical protein
LNMMDRLQQEHVQDLVKMPGVVHCIVGPSSAVVMPGGYIMSERTLTHACYGLRRTCALCEILLPLIVHQPEARPRNLTHTHEKHCDQEF